MADSSSRMLRDQLKALIDGGGAHLSFDDAIDGLPARLRGSVPNKFPHSVWRLVEHLRIAQQDIIDYIDDSGEPLSWPDDYWPSDDAPPDGKAWEKSVAGFHDGIRQFVDLVENDSVDLLAPLEHDRKKCAARQIMLAADHNAYHIAQIVMVRRMLDDWDT